MNPAPLLLNLTQVPFSRAGSYLAFSQRDLSDERPWEQRPGETVFLRTLHGDRENDRVFRLDLIAPNGSAVLSIQAEAQPHLLRLHAEGGTVDICLPASGVMRVRGDGGIGLRLTLVKVGGYGNAQPYDKQGRWLVNAWTARMAYLLSPLAGKLVVDAPFGTMHTARVVADFLPEAGRFEGLIEEFLTERRPARPVTTFDQDADAVAAEFEAFRAGLPSVSGTWQPAADLMAYVQWSALVAPEGHFQRPAMLMSKNHMTNVWSWDHCFNALALMPHDAGAGLGPVPASRSTTRTRRGRLPDSCQRQKTSSATLPSRRSTAGPCAACWNATGTALSDFRCTARRNAYGPLTRWTRWWLTYRDQDGDGVPHYNARQRLGVGQLHLV